MAKVISNCTAAFYKDKPTARDAQHRIARRYHFSTSIRFCEEHDGYHTIANVGRMKLPKRAIEAMELLGQGFNQNEICKIMVAPRSTVEWYLRCLKDGFGANSLEHLMVLAIGTGVLNVTNFLPGFIEDGGNDYARSNGERTGTERVSASSGG